MITEAIPEWKIPNYLQVQENDENEGEPRVYTMEDIDNELKEKLDETPQLERLI